MQNKAVVLRVEGCIATVEVVRASACEGCHKNKNGEGCGICSLTGANQKFSAKALNSAGASVGDLVEVQTDTRRVLFYAFLVFLLPLIVGLSAYLISGLFSFTEEKQLLFLIGGFVLVFLGTGFYSGRKGKKEPDIVITRILQNKEN